MRYRYTKEGADVAPRTFNPEEFLMLPVARVLVLLIPLASRIAKALRKDSPGGKRITPEELLGILLGEAEELEASLNA